VEKSDLGQFSQKSGIGYWRSYTTWPHLYGKAGCREGAIKLVNTQGSRGDVLKIKKHMLIRYKSTDTYPMKLFEFQLSTTNNC